MSVLLSQAELLAAVARKFAVKGQSLGWCHECGMVIDRWDRPSMGPCSLCYWGRD